MQQFFDTLQDTFGNALILGSVVVTAYPSGGAVTIYSDNGLTPIGASTVLADATGQVQFFAADGDYIVTYKNAGTTYKTRTPTSIFDSVAGVTFTDTGAVNALAVTDGRLEKVLRTGLRINVQVANTITSSSPTFQYNGLAAKPLVNNDGTTLSANQILAASILLLEYNGTSWLVRSGVAFGTPVQAIETTASAVVTNPFFLPMHPMRYRNAVGNGIADDHLAVQDAVNVAAVAGGTVTFDPPYVHLCSADISVPTSSVFGGPTVDFKGYGWANWQIIFGTGSTFGFVFLGTGATTGGTLGSNYNYAGTIADFGVKMTGTSNTAFFFNTLNQPKLERVWIAGTGGQGRGIYMLNCLLPFYHSCLMTGMGSATQGSMEVDQCTNFTWVGSRISAGNTTVGGLLVDRTAVVTIDRGGIESCGTPVKIGSKAESSITCYSVKITGIDLENPGNNPYIDIGQGLSGSALVLNVDISNNYATPSGTTTVPFFCRFNNTSGIKFRRNFVTQGATPTSVHEMNGTNVSGVYVEAHRDLQSLGIPWVRYNSVQVLHAGPLIDWSLGALQSGRPVCQVPGVRAIYTGQNLSGATPCILVPFVTATITGITVAASAVVTVSTVSGTNPYQVNQTVFFRDVTGMTQINGLIGTVTAIGGSSGAWTVTVNINSSGFGAYVSGGSMSSTMGGYFGAFVIQQGGATNVSQISGGEPGMETIVMPADSNSTLVVGNSGGATRTTSGANLNVLSGKAYKLINDGASGAGGSCWVQEQ